MAKKLKDCKNWQGGIRKCPLGKVASDWHDRIYWICLFGCRC